MKKVLSVALIVGLLVSLSSLVFAGEKYRDGSFVAFLPDDHGDLIVDLKIKNDEIVGAEILNPIKTKATYTYEPGIKAFAAFPSQVIAKQGADIDAITGATSSYNEYREAVQQALAIASGQYKGNTFYGVVRDYGHGHTVVKVTVDKAKKKILNVEIIPAQFDPKEKPRETRAVNKPAVGYPLEAAIVAYKEIPKRIVAKQSVSVDVVAGATGSSQAYMEAVKHALEQAGLNPDDLTK